jgi:hypothetical protein
LEDTVTETVQAPAGGDEAEASTPAEGQEGSGNGQEAKPTVSLKERLQKAVSKDMPAAHTGFVDWMKREGDIDIDDKSVLATQSLYNVWRKTDEFKQIKDSQPTKQAAAPDVSKMSDEEKQQFLEKHRKETERRKAAQAKADARAAEVEKFLREQGLLPGDDSDEESGDEAAEDAATDEETEEAF